MTQNYVSNFCNSLPQCSLPHPHLWQDVIRPDERPPSVEDEEEDDDENGDDQNPSDDEVENNLDVESEHWV